MAKPYQAKTLSGAQARVRLLERRLREMDALLGKYQDDLETMLKLAADGPAFNNPIEAAVAKGRRNVLLRQWCRLNPDGTPLAK